MLQVGVGSGGGGAAQGGECRKVTVLAGREVQGEGVAEVG